MCPFELMGDDGVVFNKMFCFLLCRNELKKNKIVLHNLELSYNCVWSTDIHTHIYVKKILHNFWDFILYV